MKTLVLVKAVPDTSCKIAAADRTLSISDPKRILNPYDEFAVEEAARHRGDGELVAVSLGGPEALDALRAALAMGATRAIHVQAPDLPPWDLGARAQALALIVEREAPDVVWCGRQGVDEDTGQVPARLAGILGWPLAPSIVRFAVQGGDLVATGEVEGGTVEFRTSGPAVLTANKSLNAPKYPALPAILAAKKKPVEEVALSALGVATASGIELEGYEAPPARAAGRKLTGSVDELVRAALAEIEKAGL